MNSEEAETVLDWLTTGFGARLDQNQRPVWLAVLAELDVAPAMEVAADMASRARTGDRLPVPADFRRSVHTRQHPPTTSDHGDQAKFGGGSMLVWVSVWQYLRHGDDWRTLPHQEPYAQPEMTMQEYEHERSRWAAATDNGKRQPRWGPIGRTV